MPLGETFHQVAKPHQRGEAVLKTFDDPPGPRHVDRRLIDDRQPGRAVRCHQQAGALGFAEPIQPQAAPGAELLDAVHGRHAQPGRVRSEVKVVARQASAARPTA